VQPTSFTANKKKLSIRGKQNHKMIKTQQHNATCFLKVGE